MINMEKRNILLSKSPVNVLLQLKKGEANLSEIGRQIQSTFAYVHGMVNIFEDYGYIESDIIGRGRVCRLTEKGKDAVKQIEFLLEI